VRQKTLDMTQNARHGFTGDHWSPVRACRSRRRRALS
jgi:hypothetical protein